MCKKHLPDPPPYRNPIRRVSQGYYQEAVTIGSLIHEARQIKLCVTNPKEKVEVTSC